MTNPTQPPDRRALLQQALAALEDMQAKLDASERAMREPIAIIGLGCRFPGGASDPEAFWRTLADGVDAVREVPPERWDRDAFFDPNPDAPGKMYTLHGAFLNEPVDRFDPQFFGITPREAIGMDPQQRLLLEVTWETLEHAGIAPDRLAGSRTGVFVGICTNDYAQIQSRAGGYEGIDAYFGSGVAHSIATGRISYVLGLQGPSIAVDTACSSSLVAVHLAVQSLRRRESDLALAGGVSLVLAPDGGITTSRGRMLSFDGRCKTFDAAADGYVRGEGCGMIALKRLSDAIAAGDTVLAVICGSALNQDGRSNGLTAPNGLAQEAVIRAALADADVAPAAVRYIEAHGTGTSLGDPIEMRALGAVFGKGRSADTPLAVGSVKTNIGHLEAAAGIAGLIKIVLSLRHAAIPPHLHFQRPNPYIPWETLPVLVPTYLMPWPETDSPRIAGLSSFGFSGTNAHMIIAEAPRIEMPAARPERMPRLLALSARNEAALTELAGRYAAFLETHPEIGLAEICATANAGRAHFAHRLTVIAESAAQLCERLHDPDAPGVRRSHVVRKEAPKLAFLFTGQGAQYNGMAQSLYASQPIFRAALDRCAKLLEPHLEHPLLEVVFAENPATAGLLDQTAYTQPALFAVEYALAELWRSWGIVPGAVLGHSVGEYTAAVVAGVLNLEDALRLIAARGRLMQALPPGGAMAAIFAPQAEVAAAIAPSAHRLAIAAINGPAHTVVSGEATALDLVLNQFATAGTRVQRLLVSHAFHSPLLEPMLEEFAQLAATVRFGPPQLPLISNVSGRVAGAEIQQAAYWRDHARSPVQFAAGMASLAAEGIELFLEIGPHPVLLGMGQACLVGSEAAWLPSLRRRRNDWQQLYESLAELYARGIPIDWAGVEGDEPYRRPALPTYPFQCQRYWFDAQTSAQRADLRAGSGHPLLGRRMHVPLLRQTIFEAQLGADQPAYLGDHRLNGVAVFPAAAYVEMALAAAAESGQTATLAELRLRELLQLPDDQTTPVQLLLQPESGAQAQFQVVSNTADVSATGWGADSSAALHHAEGTLVVEPLELPTPLDLEAIRADCPTRMDVADFYTQVGTLGMTYGPGFQGLSELYRGDGQSLGYAALPEPFAAAAGAYRLHPALLDACFQIIGAALPVPPPGAETPLYVPIALEGVRIYNPGASAVWCHAALLPARGGDPAASLQLCDPAGQIIATVDRLQLRRIKAGAHRSAQIANWFYQVAWQAQSLPSNIADKPTGAWLIYADAAGFGARLAAELAAGGAPVVTALPGAVTVREGVHSWRIDPADPDAPARLLREEFGETAPVGVVHFWALDAQPDTTAGRHAVLECAAASALHLAQAVAAYSGAAPRIWLITRGAQAAGGHGVQTAAAALWGFGKVIATEQPALRWSSIDLDPQSAADPLDAVLAELRADTVENQVALRGTERTVARLVHMPPPALPEGQPLQLTLPERGALDQLRFTPLARRAPGPGEVEIEVRASGLNFRDVLNVLGMYPGDPGPPGLECAGIVASVGAGVEHVRAGDAVLAVAGNAFDSFVVAQAALTVPKPANLSFAEAVTLPSAYLTAAYGLHHLARLKAGERVLIHAAAGGVGFAAVQLALAAGAEVFATAGSPEKHAFLRAMGVRHIFSSRTLEFAEQILAITGGAGVDVILNSLADAFIERSLAVLAPDGRFLEIGKRGILTPEQFAAARPAGAYYPYDLAAVLVEQPDVLPALLRELCAAAETGDIRPLPLRAFPAEAIVDAFRYMAQAKHIGKVVVTQHAAIGAVRPDANYLITGGLGGLGLTVAGWLVARGARHLTLVGRRSVVPEAESALAALRVAGAEVQTLAADIGDAEQVARVLATIAAGPVPLRGIFHAAGVLDDGMLAQQRWERFERVLAPKADGAWHLHDQTRGLPLDYFVLFSSASVLLGAPGQSNYAAANAILDALAHQRRAAGLPALSVNWGAWSDVGMAAALDQRDRERAAARGMGTIAPAEGVAALEALLARGVVQAAVLPMNWQALREQIPDAMLPPLIADLARAVSASRQTRAPELRLTQLLAATPPAEQRTAIMAYVQQQVIRVLGLDPAGRIEPHQGLTDLGMDSLMAVELSNRLRVDLGRPVPSTLAFEHPTVSDLTDYLAAEVLGVAPEQAPKAEQARNDAEFAELAQLSDAEAEAQLLRELEESGY